MAPARLVLGALLYHVVCMGAAVADGSSAAASVDQLAASEGLQASCRQAIQKLSAELDQGSTRLEAMFTITQAAVATGRIMEALPLLNAAFMSDVARDVRLKDVMKAMNPFISPGSPDSCAYIHDFHYCRIDLLSSYLRFGVCVPSACGAADVAVLINNTYHHHDVTQGLFGSTGNQWLTPHLPLEQSTRCGSRAYGFAPTTATYVMAAVTAVLVALAALATGVDRLRHRHKVQAKEQDECAGPKVAVQHGGAASRRYEHDGLLMRSLLCWSVFKNARALTSKQRGGDVDSLDGMRALSATWIVLSHTFSYGLMNPGYTNLYSMVEARGHRGLMATYAGQAIPGGYFAVDSFLFIGAFLAVYLMLRHLQRRNEPHSWSTLLSSFLNAPRIYVLRYLRLTPAYAYVVFMYWHVLRVADKGPFWTAVFEPEYAACERSWYRNFLYVNNFTMWTGRRQIQLCYGATWYLALDFQLFLLTPLVAGLAYWRHTWALLLLALCMVASVAWAYVESVRQQWSVDTLDETTYFFTYYLLPWFRAPPYLVGMGLAIISHTYLSPRLHQSQKPNNMLLGGSTTRGWACHVLLYTGVLLLAVVTYGARGAFGNMDHPWTQDRMNAYVALSKPAWSLGLASLALSLFSGHGGWIKSMLESRPLAIVSRLTYCVYLVHVGVIQWLYAMIGPVHWSMIWCIVVYLGVLSTVLLLSTFVHLLVESPVCALMKLLTSKDVQSAKLLCNSDRIDTDRSDVSGKIADRSDISSKIERKGPVKLYVTLQADCESKCDAVYSSNV